MTSKGEMIHGHSIVAMSTDETSVAEIMTLLGVNPTTELVAEAISRFGNKFDMSSVHDFLQEKQLMCGNVEQHVYDCADVRSKANG